MELIAERVKTTRDATFKRTATVAGRSVVVNHTLGIASLGGATMDNEWNYVQAKLWRGLEAVIENQAVYDTPPRSPVWGSRLDEAARRRSSRTCRTPIAS